MHKFVGPQTQAPRMVFRAQFTFDNLRKALAETSKQDFTGILRSELYGAAKLTVDAYRSSVPSSGLTKETHLRDSLGIRVRSYHYRSGAYAVIGEKIVNGRTLVKNFHVQEKGSTLRFRKRIGGKYAWVEHNIARLSQTEQVQRRRTGMVVGQHYLERAFNSQLEAMCARVASGFQNKVLFKWATAKWARQ